MSTNVPEFLKLGRFEIRDTLGKGAMGTVYLAHDTHLNRNVAIKCVSTSSASDNAAENLRREARLLAQLNHQNIVQLYDVIEDQGTIGLVMEYVEGQTLLQQQRETLPSLAQCATWLYKISLGLEAAHANGIVHCDLKTENILVTKDGEIKIADFGIAKIRLQGSTQKTDQNDGKSYGSSYSVSPEQALSKELDFRSDLFSFGILAYLLLSGRHPFGKTNNRLEMIQRIINDPFVATAEDEEKLGTEIIDLISTLLQKEVKNRPSSTHSISEFFRVYSKSCETTGLDENDLTMLLPEILPHSAAKSRKFYLAAGSAVVIAVMAASAWFHFRSSAPATLYIAVPKTELTTSENIDEAQATRISLTIENSIEDFLLSSDSLSLVSNIDVDKFDGDYSQMAKASASDIVILSEVDCAGLQCQVSLKKLAPNTDSQWVVSEQYSWPVIADSLADIGATTYQQAANFFPLQSINEQSSELSQISEESYRDYLQAYLASSAGSGASDSDLSNIESLIRAYPSFLSLYSLLSKASIHLFKRTGDTAFLDRLNYVLEGSPSELKKRPQLKRHRFELLLQRKQYEDAQNLLDEIEETSNDRVLIIDLQASLAYATNDHELGLELDQKSAVLMPSTLRLYNLALSQYLMNDLDGSKKSLSRALELYPSHLYSHNLLAAIALKEGKLDEAIRAYESILADSPDSENLSNYGVALTLGGNFSSAIKALEQAVELNPLQPAYLLNLADAVSLSGERSRARSLYANTLKLVSEPTTNQEYGIRAQALAHLGRYTEAIQTFRTAEEKYPNRNKLHYASAIVNTLANNEVAAIVDIQAAVKSGTGLIWFRFPWFKQLCEHNEFIQIIEEDDTSVCRF